MRSLYLLGLSAWVAAVPVSAQQITSSSISLADARALALEKSPLVTELDSEYATRLAEAVEVTLFPNPELGVGVNVPVDWKDSKGDNELELSVSQPLRLSYFGTRSAVSDLIKKAASADQKAAIFKLMKEIDLAYVRLWTLQEQRRFLETARKSSLNRSKGITEGVSKGIYSEGDQKLFAGDAARIEAEMLGVEGDIKAGEAKLTSLTGTSLSSRTLSKPEMTARLVADEVRAKEKANSIGASQRAALLTELATSQTRLAKRDSFPEFTPQLLISRNDEGTTFIGAGLTMPLPFSNRNQPQIMQREAALRAAAARRDYVENGAFQDEISSIVAAANLAMEEATLFESKVIPAFRESLHFQERQFSAGSGSIVQIWQTQRELFDAQGRGLELWTKAFSLRIELEILIGQEL